jgi:hypothetical protein
VPLCVVIDDRLEVWEPESRQAVLQVPGGGSVLHCVCWEQRSDSKWLVSESRLDGLPAVYKR